MQSDWRLDRDKDESINQSTSDLGLRCDLRHLTRLSMPKERPLSDNGLLPDCAQLLRNAALAKQSKNEEAYAQNMRALQDFFMSGALPTPAQVRQAFRLPSPSQADMENEAQTISQLYFLDRSKASAILNEKIDANDLDALAQAEEWRAALLQKNN